MSDEFYIGQKVLCVYDGPIEDGLYIMGHGLNNRTLDGLTKGQTYTIRWHGFFLGQFRKAQYCVRLHEIMRDINLNGEEPPYIGIRFKPLKEKPTDISVFKAMETDPERGGLGDVGRGILKRIKERI